MNANISSWLLALTFIGVVASARGNEPVPRTEDPSALSVPGAVLHLAHFRAESVTSQALSTRASGIASVLANAEVPYLATDVVSRALAVTPGRADFLMESSERIRVLIDPAQSGLLAVHGAVADDFASEVDVGTARAQTLFHDTLKALVSRHLVEPDGLALGRVRSGRVMQAETPRGGQSKPRIKEYFFEVPRVVGDVEVFGASLTISVHRSGRIASIRTEGPSAVSDKETFKREISAASLTERARHDNPRAEIVPLGLRYPWKAASDDTRLISRPREAFRVVPVTEVEGRKIHGRSHYVFYALDNDKEPPIVWPKPNPTATGDARK